MIAGTVSLVSIYGALPMNCSSSPGNVAANGIQSLPLWNLHSYCHHCYCRFGLGCCSGEIGMPWVMPQKVHWSYFHFTWKGRQAKPLSLEFKLFLSEPVDSLSAFPMVLVRAPEESHCTVKAACLQPTARNSALCIASSKIACKLGNYYWWPQLFTNVAVTVICALIFFPKPIYFVSAVLECSEGFPHGRCY